ncbi:hypothetical protein IE81DRAFT_331636 [Ceraceosorus guamensis]|uniref:Uncharacterized protein n=1 Tax=Ceraceosorus guamensis TaxID=1522189 RepID=A0A316VU87_9BASI|nr:hypothetical protein IE81DRAFT_331636 [Ceraceosorus guamensis]PWN40458.1 hypothetical protein IE81DRAFT_331636 [Ceraceosorus guamensis]
MDRTQTKPEEKPFTAFKILVERGESFKKHLPEWMSNFLMDSIAKLCKHCVALSNHHNNKVRLAEMLAMYTLVEDLLNNPDPQDEAGPSLPSLKQGASNSLLGPQELFKKVQQTLDNGRVDVLVKEDPDSTEDVDTPCVEGASSVAKQLKITVLPKHGFTNESEHVQCLQGLVTRSYWSYLLQAKMIEMRAQGGVESQEVTLDLIMEELVKRFDSLPEAVTKALSARVPLKVASPHKDAAGPSKSIHDEDPPEHGPAITIKEEPQKDMEGSVLDEVEDTNAPLAAQNSGNNHPPTNSLLADQVPFKKGSLGEALVPQGCGHVKALPMLAFEPGASLTRSAFGSIAFGIPSSLAIRDALSTSAAASTSKSPTWTIPLIFGPHSTSTVSGPSGS